METVTKELVAKLDASGSETAKSFHYTFGRLGNELGGGLYIPKTMSVPDKLVIHFVKDASEVIKEREVENAKC